MKLFTHCLKLSFKKLVFLFSFLFLFLLSPQNAFAYYTNMSASVVVGQPDFTSGSINQGLSSPAANTLNISSSSRGIFVDSMGRLIISDTGNHRVLIYNRIPIANNTSADLVLGQPNFTSSTPNNGGRSAISFSIPSGIFSDGTKLIIADKGNSRVLIWNTLPKSNRQPADVVVGQSNMTNNAFSCDNAHFSDPTGVVVVNGRLFVSDLGYNRILIWNTIPTTNGVAADVVLGQTDFVSCGTTTASASTLKTPLAIWADSSKFFVTDTGYNRVLIWNSLPTSNGQPADVVVGQPDFTSSSVLPVSASTLPGGPQGVCSVNNRLFIGDSNSSNRVLVYNQIPTTNGVSADVVIGQTNFTNSSANGGGSTSATGVNVPHSILCYGNQLFVSDTGNSRLLIFNNVISSPQMNITLPPTPLSDGTGRIRVYGNVELGERPNYSLQWVKAEVNGEGLGYVTNLSGGRDNGTSETLYDFYHDFNPGSVVNSDINNFTLKLVASSFNADTSSLFYFTPFILNSALNNNFSFSVNKYQIERIKDNIDHFEVWVHSSSSPWTQYISGIPTSLIDTTTGQVVVTATTPGISFPNVVTPGIYDVKIKGISKNSGWGEDSNTISGISLTGTSGAGSTSTTGSLVLQINSIDENTDILSTFNQSGIKTNYGVTTLTPEVSGISWAGSLITLGITNKDDRTQFKTYTTRVNPDSSFSLFPSLYTNSIINFSVTKDGMYNFIPSFNLNSQ